MPRNSCIWPTATPRTGPLSVATTGDFGAADAPVGTLAMTAATTATMATCPMQLDVIVVPPQVEFSRDACYVSARQPVKARRGGTRAERSVDAIQAPVAGRAGELRERARRRMA